MTEIMKPSTIYDIAKRVGVSPATVSRVLNNKGRTSKETADKILSVAKELNYIPNSFARSLKTKETMQIMISIPDHANPFYFKMIDKIHKQAKANGYSILLHLTDAIEKEEIKNYTYAQE